MESALLQSAGKHFRLAETLMGDLGQIRGRGMLFSIKTRYAEGIDSLCVIGMKGMAGLMRMQSAAFTSRKRDGPILSMDWIHALGKETLLTELYGTTLSPDPPRA